MMNLDFLRRNAQSTVYTSRTMVKSGEDFILTETVEYTISKQKLDGLKQEANILSAEVEKQKSTFIELEKEGPIDLSD